MLALARNLLVVRAAVALVDRRRAVVKARRTARVLRWAALVAAAGAGVAAFLSVRRQRAGASAPRKSGVLPLPGRPMARKKVAREARREAAARRDDAPPEVVAEVTIEMNEIEDLSVPISELTARKR